MGENQDISKIIGIIMENPDIIAKIKELAADSSEKDGSASVNSQVTEEAAPVVNPTSDENSYSKLQSKKRRRELLTALKPYVKSERAKAIDTMLSVIDVIDVMKER